MIVTYDAQARTFTMRGQALVSTYPIAERIPPVKTTVRSGLTIALHTDHLAQVFDSERSECEHLDVGIAINPD